MYDNDMRVTLTRLIVAFCKMPTETGICGKYTIRWFYDSAVGMCTRNWYSGCEVDAHHFDREEDCQSVCVTPKGLGKSETRIIFRLIQNTY